LSLFHRYFAAAIGHYVTLILVTTTDYFFAAIDSYAITSLNITLSCQPGIVDYASWPLPPAIAARLADVIVIIFFFHTLIAIDIGCIAFTLAIFIFRAFSSSLIILR